MEALVGRATRKETGTMNETETSSAGAPRKAAVVLAGLVATAAALYAAFGLGATSGTAAQSQYAPSNTAAPGISGTFAQGQTLTAANGTWAGTAPITFSYVWQRCDSVGANCANIPGATARTYTLVAADVGRRLKVRVTASNSTGAAAATSPASPQVQAGGVSGEITLPSGEKSIPVTSVPATERLIVQEVRFSPTAISSRTDPIQIQVKVKDTRGYVVRDARVFVRSTPLVTTTPSRGQTGQDGTIVYNVLPEDDFPAIRNGYNIQYFVKVYRDGDDPLAGVAGYRLVQVPLRK
jgi:hypothetical protein